MKFQLFVQVIIVLICSLGPQGLLGGLQIPVWIRDPETCLPFFYQFSILFSLVQSSFKSGTSDKSSQSLKISSLLTCCSTLSRTYLAIIAKLRIFIFYPNFLPWWNCLCSFYVLYFMKQVLVLVITIMYFRVIQEGLNG